MTRTAGRSDAAARHAVGTTDILKAGALLFVLVDHTGMFFFPDGSWWRVFGRIAAPVFFFLIGFARSRQVPWTWIALGLALTVLDRWTSRSGAVVELDLLLSFALLRACVLPVLAEHAVGRPLRLVAAAAAGAALIPVLAAPLEYGAEGWLWSLFGLAQRHVAEHPEDRRGDAAGLLVGGAAAASYWVTERDDYGFDPLESAVLAALVGMLVVVLRVYRRTAWPWPLPPVLARPLRFAGTRSLEIYGATLFAMQLLGYALHGPTGDDPDDDA